MPLRPFERIPLHAHSDRNDGGAIHGPSIVAAVGGESTGGGGSGGGGSGSAIDLTEGGSTVIAAITAIDAGHGLDGSNPSGTVGRLAVDETELDGTLLPVRRGGTPVEIIYTFDTTTTDADPGAGLLRLSNASQYLAVTVRADLADVAGADVTAMLDSLGDAISTTKGYLRLQHATDPTKWLVATVSAIASPSGYRNITVANLSKSANSPFANGDILVLTFVPGALGHHAAHEPGGADAMAVDAAQGTGSLRTISTATPQAPSGSGSAGAGTSASAANHVHPLTKLDDLAAPDDNTDLNASTSAHGLLKKLPGGTSTFLRGDGSFAVVAGSGAASYMSRRVLASVANTSTTFNVNSTSYQAIAALAFWHDWDQFPATHFLITGYANANESTKTITAQLATVSAPGTAYSAGGDDLSIPFNGGGVGSVSSGWVAVAAGHSGLILMCIAVKGSTATVDLVHQFLDIAFKVA